MRKGTLVLVKYGPFADFEGVVVSTHLERVVIRIVLKRRAVLVELEKTMIEMRMKNRARAQRLR